MGVPIVSVGNLIAGGAGKTPVTAALASRFEDAAVVLRGYGRKSRGLVVVSHRGEIKSDVESSGDEAMLLARSLPKASVIVSEDRIAGIERAKELGAKAIFLDDGFGACVEKLDLLIDPDPPNRRCIPAGPYRYPRSFLQKADLVLKEGRDFIRKVSVKNRAKKMVLLTAIANPQRLDPFLPEGITARYTFCDHHYFSEAELAAIWQKERPDTFLVTQKDAVKLENFSYPLSVLELSVKLHRRVIEAVERHIKG